MSSIPDALAALDAAVETLREADWESLDIRDRFNNLERLETAMRRQRALSHKVIDGLDDEAVGAPVALAVSDVLRISRSEARRRVRDAAQLQPRATLTGQPVPPDLPATAAAWRDGILDPEHLRAIQAFISVLPDHVPPAQVQEAETFLADHAALLRPDQLEKLAAQLALRLNPDGRFSDSDRARKRGFAWCGRQGPDGMSVGRLVATPELRAMLDAWLAKFAAPGMCNPDDQSPAVSDEPCQEVIDRDTRSQAQRQHDALGALVRGQLGDPKLGQHMGLPVTLIVSATLEQLQTGAGVAVAAGGALLPMPDLIRMASHAWHYLAVFDQHTERALYLGRSRRIASPDQRVVLHAKDRGCTAPGCDVPGYLCETHHVDEWTDGGLTNIDRLTFACGPHHRLIKPGGWSTRKRADGTTEWHPPPQLPIPGRVNSYHHPERML